MQDTAEKIRENRLRRMAERQGYRMEKCRRRDPRALGFGTFQLVDVQTGTLAYGYGSQLYGLNLNEIEAILTGKRDSPAVQAPTASRRTPEKRAAASRPRTKGGK